MSREPSPFSLGMQAEENGSLIVYQDAAAVAFNNTRDVQNQVHHQVIHGNVNFLRGRRRKLQPIKFNEAAAARAQQALDDSQAVTSLPTAILASLAFPEMLDRRTSVETPYSGTCQWILERDEFKAWRTASSGLLWIKGKPGAGKSTLMAHMYRVIRGDLNNVVRLEFFFSARGVQLQHTPLGMLRSLLCQIFEQHRETRDILRRPYQEKCALFGKRQNTSQKNSWQWQRSELELILTDIILTAANGRQLFIFIDALDEAGEQAARQIARYFHTINDRVVQAETTAKICISCRHYPILSTIHGTEIHVEKYNHGDITAYIEEYLKPDRSQPSSEWDELKSYLVQQANGIFQWVCLITPIVEKYIMDGDSPQDIRRWLNQVPKELQSVYLYILQNVIDPKYARKSFRLFQWVCLAQRPLSLTELRYALATHDISQWSQTKCNETHEFIKDNKVMDSRIKSLSGGLIEVVTSDHGNIATAHVIHQSVNDFFLPRGLELLATRFAHDQDGCSTTSITPGSLTSISYYHRDLYWSCLRYLLNEKKSKYNELFLDRSPYNGATLTSVRKRHADQIRGKYPFLEYAALNALAHGEKARIYRCNNLEEETQMLEKIMPYWMRVRMVFEEADDSYIEPGATSLHIATAGNLEDLAAYLLEHGSTTDAEDGERRTALHVAAFWGRLTIAKRLVDAGADTQKLTLQSRTPFLVACEKGHSELFSLLVNQDVKLQLLTDYSHDIQFAAASQGDAKTIRILIEAGINNRSRTVHGSVLEIASQKGHADIVGLLIEADVDAGVQNRVEDYSAAISAAAAAGHHQVVRILVEAGGDVNAVSLPYGTALQAASYKCHTEVVRLLTQAGADPNLRGGLYDNPLHAALYLRSSSTAREEIVRLLIGAGADINQQGGFFGFALQAASCNGHESIVRLLIKAGADVNQQGGSFGYALQAAFCNGYDLIVRLLIEAGADVNKLGGSHEHVLQAASSKGRELIVRLLIEAGADVNMKGGTFGCALQAAACGGHESTARLLIDAGAEVNARGGRHGTALRAAMMKPGTSVASLLTDRGAHETEETKQAFGRYYFDQYGYLKLF